MEGETAALSCTISDFTSPVVWRRNHIPLQNGDKYEICKEGKVNLLRIHDADPLDTGTYSCDTGDVQSSAKLTVTGKALLLLDCESKHVYLTESVNLTFLPWNDKCLESDFNRQTVIN